VGEAWRTNARETPPRIFTIPSHDRSHIVTKEGRLQGNLPDMQGPLTTAPHADSTPRPHPDAQQTQPRAKVDMHCHSTASQESKLGVQRALGLPECATPPQEVYDLAKRRGMDFVTITDHDTIAGVLEIADRPDVFISEELTTHFRGEPQAVHVLCYGITQEDHEWLQTNNHDVELCAAYLYEREIVCALAHPYYTVAAPLGARHRRRLAELFGVWEIRNGARAPELNRPAATYAVTREVTGIGGSDDHAGVDIGRTYTESPPAGTPRDFLEHVRSSQVLARGAQGSAAKWAHAAIALAARALGAEPHAARRRPDPGRVMTMMRRLLSEGDARHGAVGSDLSPEDARCLLQAWLGALELEHLDERGLVAYMQEDGFSHSDLYRRACRLHERKLRRAVGVAVAAATGEAEIPAAAEGLFEACVAAIPYAPATAFLAAEQAKLAAIPHSRSEDGERPRVAILADGIGSTHGVTRTIEEIRQRGVPGFEIEVVGTDPEVDARLPSVADIDVPFYPGLRIGVPSLPAAVQTLSGLGGRGYEAIHVCSPGPAGIAGALVARALRLPLVGSYHTELTAYAGLRSGERRVADATALAVSAFYHACDVVLSPSRAADEALAAIGMPAERVLRWDRGVDTTRFRPTARDTRRGETINVMYSGRITREKGVDLLAAAFLLARSTEPRLHLTLAGGGPEQERLRERLGEHASFLGWLEGDALAHAYGDADVFLFPSSTDTFGQVILEAQASGLPVIAVAEGGPLSLVEDGVSGRLCEADAGQLADAVLELAGSPLLREHLSRGGLAAVAERTWERTLERLSAGYRRVLPEYDVPEALRAA
jgi:glycosyltransferase involved in cell wall biosynthesis/predicted metal-dependent phosphoesterase TrpH